MQIQEKPSASIDATGGQTSAPTDTTPTPTQKTTTAVMRTGGSAAAEGFERAGRSAPSAPVAAPSVQAPEQPRWRRNVAQFTEIVAAFYNPQKPATAAIGAVGVGAGAIIGFSIGNVPGALVGAVVGPAVSGLVTLGAAYVGLILALRKGF